MSAVLPDPSTPFGERVARRLRDEIVVWLTTTSADGTPQPNPVWFLWEPDRNTILVYSLPDAARIAHIKRDAHISLNFDGNGRGGDIVVITGEARIESDEVPANENPAYAEKYRRQIEDSFKTPENFAREYSLPVRIVITKVRGH